MSFCHLHVHSDASDGIGTPEALVYAARMRSQTAIALTDHGTLTNMIAFYLAAEKANVKPIIGQEIYIAVPKPGDEKTPIHHMTVLVMNQVGLENLYKLTTIGAKSSFRKPAITLQDLIKYNEGLILLSGCCASPIYHLEGIRLDSFVSQIVFAFGNRFYLEVTLVPGTDTFTRIQDLHKRFLIPMVVTSDVHYIDREDTGVHNATTMMKMGFSYESAGLWLKTENEMRGTMRAMGIENEEMLQESGRIANRIEPLSLVKPPSLPKYENAREEIANAVKEEMRALNRRGISVDELRMRMARAKTEFEMITRLGYLDYFAIVKDIVDWARSNGVRIGPGRGSAAGSYLLYILGVTSIDPIVWDLSFERFLNPLRSDMPDVDIDFDMDRRGDVIAYMNERWGGVPIATYSRYSHKMLIHDLAKAYGIPRELEQAAADDIEGDSFDRLIAEYPEAGKAYGKLHGTIRHRGRHASGLIITNQPIPLERAGDTLVVPWTEGHDKELSKIGLIKFDILGLSAVSALEAMRISSGGREPGGFGEDDRVLNLFREGDLLGIFQFSGSRGIQKLTMSVSPTSGEDLVAINALYRPGALDVGSAQAYPKWKKNPRKLHPRIDGILKPTFGAIIYQEQVMRIYAEIVGGDMASADIARRVIVKSKVGDPEWERELALTRDQFVHDGSRRGFEPTFLEHLWGELVSHSRYSFNRAHAVCYSHIAYAMAWHKVHTPSDFYAAMMNYDGEHAEAYIYEALQRGIAILPPHVNVSTDRYEPGAMTIAMPLSSVKFLGDKGVSSIINARRVGGPFKSAKDLVERVEKRHVNARARRSLYLANALSGMPLMMTMEAFGIGGVELIPGSREAARESLSVQMPTPQLVKRIEAIRAKGSPAHVCGLVRSITKKRKPYGQIWSCDIYPSGFFWTTEAPDFQVGEAVLAAVKGRKAVKVKVL